MSIFNRGGLAIILPTTSRLWSARGGLCLAQSFIADQTQTQALQALKEILYSPSLGCDFLTINRLVGVRQQGQY